MEEIFKDVKGYEGLYQVSNLGNVKSLERFINDGKGGLRVLRERFLKAGASKTGYYTVALHKNKVQKSFNVHQLVAIAFLNHVPDGHYIVVDHIDENTLNNRFDNLQLITNRENRVRSINKSKTSSQYVGVCWAKASNKWLSYIKINGKTKHLGLFTDELDAHEAYQKALMEVNNC